MKYGVNGKEQATKGKKNRKERLRMIVLICAYIHSDFLELLAKNKHFRPVPLRLRCPSRDFRFESDFKGSAALIACALEPRQTTG